MTKPKAKIIPMMTPEQKKVWQELANRRFKPFIADMERLEVAARVDLELIHPESNEKIVAETLMTSYYKKKAKK